MRYDVTMSQDVLDADIKDFIDAFDLLDPETWMSEHCRIFDALADSGFRVRSIHRYPGDEGYWEVILVRAFGLSLGSMLEVGRSIRTALNRAGVPVSRDMFRLFPNRRRMIAEFVYDRGQPGQIRYLPRGRREILPFTGPIL